MKDTTKQSNKNILAGLFFALVSVLISWQMLLPGYILSLDMIFVPKLKVLFGAGMPHNTLLLKYVLNFANYLLPGWVIEKVMIFCLFFLIGFLSYRFLPVPKKYGLAFWAAIFYTATPFVYERFLAGQWPLLFAYAFLPALSFYLIRFFQNPDYKNAFWLFFWLFLISLFSIHFLAIASVVIFIYALYCLMANLKNESLIKNSAIKLSMVGVSLLVFSLYWLLPFIANFDNSVVSGFDEKNWQAFKTASDQHLGTALNVLALYGFWGEAQPWANYFLWPKDNFYFWAGLLAVILSLVAFGICQSLKRPAKEKTVFFLLCGILGFIFSCGVGETIFKGFNQFLFNQLWFWPGFRDTEKWSGLLCLSYSYFAAFGLYVILEKLSNKFAARLKYFIALIFLIPILYTYPIWGGFSRQLKPVWFPASWQQTNQLLNDDQSDFKILFLPWHQYLSLGFNQKLITLNPAKEFFDREVIIGENMEIGEIFSQGGNELANEIQAIIFSQKDPDWQAKELASKGIKYIILSHDLAALKNDSLPDLISSSFVEKVLDKEDLTLYRISL
ncbi:MAG: hypothetical protein WC768_03470 [Patescibacteria group bacterium]|jgi:hypothetical protein